MMFRVATEVPLYPSGLSLWQVSHHARQSTRPDSTWWPDSSFGTNQESDASARTGPAVSSTPPLGWPFFFFFLGYPPSHLESRNHSWVSEEPAQTVSHCLCQAKPRHCELWPWLLTGVTWVAHTKGMSPGTTLPSG